MGYTWFIYQVHTWYLSEAPQAVPVEKFQFSGIFFPIWSELVHFDGNIELNLVYVEKQITNIIFDQVCYHVANIWLFSTVSF